MYPLFLLCLYGTLSFVRCVPEVNTASTLIRGTEVQYNNVTVNQYLGIPFAKPPVGELRFKKTVPLEDLPGEYNATDAPPACSQHFIFDYRVVDNMPGNSEDCLYLNIWVPSDASRQNPKAVMIWLYAGSFTTGSNRLAIYDATVLSAMGNIIVVTPNYRLGIFGYLSTYSEEAPGNMGLYDVLEALRWVNLNIEAFGGDANRITISGNTAGSLIGGLFTISPLTKGLFQRVIMESGAENVVRGDLKQYNLRLGQQVATVVDCASESKTLQNNTKEVIACLKNKTADELVSAVNSLIKTSLVSFIPNFGDEILPEFPSQAYENGHMHNVSILIGNCKNEGSFQLVSENPEVFGFYGEKDPEINKTLGEQYIDGVLTMDEIAANDRSQIIDYYLSNVTDSNFYDIRSQTFRAIGDVTIFCNDYFFASMYSSFGLNVWFYYFIRSNPKSNFANWTTPTLFTEIDYVFGIPIKDSNFLEEDANLSRKIVQLWSNFVKNGVPSSDWKTFNGSDSSPYVEILQVEGGEYEDPYQRFQECDFLKPHTTNYKTD